MSLIRHDFIRVVASTRWTKRALVTVMLASCVFATTVCAEPRLEILERGLVDRIEQAYVSYPSGELTVTGWLFVNPFSENDVEPCIIFNHGGVGGVSEWTRAKCRWLATQGFVVFAPSYRGEDDSEGEIEVAMGEVDDIVAIIGELRQHPGILPNSFVLMGTSHGALISVKAACRPELCGLLRGIVPAYGVMDMYTWYQHLLDNDFDVSDPLSVRLYGTGPEDKPEAFSSRHAPNFFGSLCDTPMHIVQGAKDLIVPVAQAESLYEELRGLGREVDTLNVYSTGGHGFLFWDDPELHTSEELVETEEAWKKVLAFMHRVTNKEQSVN